MTNRQYKFETASGHTIEATRTATGYDFHTRNAEGVTISTVAVPRMVAEILVAELEAETPAPKRAARRKATK